LQLLLHAVMVMTRSRRHTGMQTSVTVGLAATVAGCAAATMTEKSLGKLSGKIRKWVSEQSQMMPPQA